VVLYGPNTVTTRLELGNATGWAGDRTSDGDQVSELLPIRDRVLGAEHAGPYRCAPNSPVWIRAAGDSAAARVLHALLLPIDERVFRFGTSDTVFDRAGLAVSTGEAGDPPPPAISPPRWCPSVRGSSAASPAVRRCRLADWNGEAGGPGTARDRYAELLPSSDASLAAIIPAPWPPAPSARGGTKPRKVSHCRLGACPLPGNGADDPDDAALVDQSLIVRKRHGVSPRPRGSRW
jgi:hypothetical protein